MDKQKIDQFWKRRARIKDPRVATHFKHDDALEYDVQLIEQHLRPNARVLDLGCGTCAMVNKIAHLAGYVRAVDKQSEFLSNCVDLPHVETVASDIAQYRDTEHYDLILLFGVMNYFDETEALEIYQRCRNMLTQNGTLIVKHACGVNEDVEVDKYSDEIGDWYYAVYRQADKEKALLQHIYSVDMVDIYPPELNRWDNTHFFAFICNPKEM